VPFTPALETAHLYVRESSSKVYVSLHHSQACLRDMAIQDHTSSRGQFINHLFGIGATVLERVPN
jgi:hypothetical protein